VCPSCRVKIELFSEPWCIRCGAPEGVIECRCDRLPVEIDMARSAGPHAGWLRHAIHHFKYGGEPARAHHLASLMIDAARSLPSIDGIVPVPLHDRRRRTRGYNQSELLSRELSEMIGVPVLPALIRTRNTPQQARLSREERATNVKDAFAIAPRAELGSRSLLLLDDVMTTSATVTACARALKEAGAGWVGVLTLTREDAAASHTLEP
jgi:ComF family protein